MRKVLLPLLFISSLTFLVISCEKGVAEPFPPPVNNQKTLVRFPEAAAGYLKTLALDLTPGVAAINVIEIRRDAVNAADLNRTLVVKIKDQNAVLSDETSGGVEKLSETLYTVHPDNPFDGQYWTVTFNPGEFVKHIKILLDPATLITLPNRVGLGFIIADAQGAHISDDKNKIAVEISAKNAWDGIYRVTWTNYHPTANPGYTGDVTDVEMRTTAATKVKIFWPLAGAYCAPSILNGGLSYFLSQEPEYTVAGNNSVTVQNAFPGAVTFYTMATGFNSRYEPGPKTFFVKWGYSYAVPGVFDVNCREWTQTLVYLGPR